MRLQHELVAIPVTRTRRGARTAGDETLAEAFWSVARGFATRPETLAPWDITPLSCGRSACSGVTA